MNSPFPWAPGHAYSELEFFVYKKIASNDKRMFLFPWLSGPISEALQSKMGKYLSDFGIFIISDPHHIHNAFANSSHLDISVSSIKYLPRRDIPASHYRVNDNPGIYSQLLSPESKAIELMASNQALNTDIAEYIELSIDHGKVFSDLREAIKSKPSSHKLIQQIDESGQQIVLINVREHQANASVGMRATSFEPLASYLQDKKYLVIDISHDNKSSEVDALCEKYNIIKYWKLDQKSPAVDIELVSRASFYVGQGGISHLSLMLKVPTLWIGGLYPVLLSANFGCQVPCYLKSIKRSHTLTYDEQFGVGLSRPELWDLKYDSWLRKYTNGNMHNCNDELESIYSIYRPSGYSILKSFIEVESSSKTCLKDSLYESLAYKDLRGKKYQYLSASRVWLENS